MGYTNNLKAAYTEQLLKNHIGGNPINDITKVNKGGIYYSALSGNKLVIGEAKAVKSLSMSDLKNYIRTDSSGNFVFNPSLPSKVIKVFLALLLLVKNATKTKNISDNSQ